MLSHPPLGSPQDLSPQPARGPPPAPAAAEEEWAPWPPASMRMKLAPYAFYRVFGSMGRAGDILGGAYLALIVLLYVVKFLSFSSNADLARFWGPVCREMVSLYCVATVCVICVFIRYHMAVDGVYVVEYDPPQPPAASEQMAPPPPPEMDMC